MNRCLCQRFVLPRISSSHPRPSYNSYNSCYRFFSSSRPIDSQNELQKSLNFQFPERRSSFSTAAAEVTTTSSSIANVTVTTTTTVEPLSIIQPEEEDDDDNDSVLNIVQITQQKLKENSADFVARFFSDHYCKNENDNPHLGLMVILDNLHDNPQQSEGFLKGIQKLANEKNNTETTIIIRPMIDHYRKVIHAWHDFNPTSAKRTQALLDYMEQYAGINYETETCNLVLKTWAKKENAEGAHAFFDKIIRKKVPLNLDSYSHVLLAWSKSKSPLAAKRADDILLHMERFTNFEPNSECILRVIESWGKSKRHGAEIRTENLFTTLKQQLTKQIIENDKTSSLLDNHKCDDGDITNLQTALWNVLQAYQKDGNAHRSEEILLDYVDDYETNNKIFPPTTEMFLSVLMTWNKSSSTNRATRSEKLLRMMENKNTVFPQPNIACYTAVLNCIASSKKPDAAKRAETLLRRMDNNNEETKPNLLSFTCVLIAWARSNDLDAHIQAERIFQDIQDRGMKPDRYVFAGLIASWGRSNSEDSILKVENYLQRIKSMAEEESILSSKNNNEKASSSSSSSFKPTVAEYTAVIQAYTNYVSRNIDKSRESVMRVESLLDEMLKSEDKILKPNTLTYAAVLKCIEKSRRIPDRGNHADAVLQKMYSEQVEITPYIINIVKRCHNIRKLTQSN